MIAMGKIVFDTENMELTPGEMERMIGNLRAFLESERDAAIEKEKKETRAKELDAEIVVLRGNLATAIAEYISAITEKVKGEKMSVEECDELHTKIYKMLKSMETFEFGSQVLGIHFKPSSCNFIDLVEKSEKSQEKPNVSRDAKQNLSLSDEDVLKTFAKLFGE